MLLSVLVFDAVLLTILFLNTIQTSLAHGTAELAINDLPFQVSIQLKNSSNQFKHQCFGSIIHELIILTAAHCFYKTSNPASFTVVVGRDILNTTTMVNRYNVTQIVKHKYFYPLKGYDIALVKLASNLTLDGQLLDKVMLNTEEYLKSGQPGYAIGRNQDKISDEDPYLTLIPHRTIDNMTCRKSKFIHVTATELCAISFKSFGPCDVSDVIEFISNILFKIFLSGRFR